MGKKMAKAGLFSLAALGAGAAVFMAGKKEKGCAKKCTAPKEKKQTDYSDYRNTERDKQKKNSKIRQIRVNLEMEEMQMILQVV